MKEEFPLYTHHPFGHGVLRGAGSLWARTWQLVTENVESENCSTTSHDNQ
jgi:hypothetical protein